MNQILELADAYARMWSADYMEAIRLRNLLKEEIYRLQKDNSEEAAYYEELNRGYEADRI